MSKKEKKPDVPADEKQGIIPAQGPPETDPQIGGLVSRASEHNACPISLASAPWRVPTLIGQRPTSIAWHTEEGRALLVNLQGPADVSVAELNGELFEVRNYLVMTRADVDEETGEYKEYPYTVLISPYGKTLGSTSEVVPHVISRMIQAFGPAPWEPPIPVTCSLRMSKRKQRFYHDLRVFPRGTTDKLPEENKS